MKKPQKTIDEYIEPFPLEVRRRLQKMRQTMRAAAPKAEEAIRRGMPTFQLNGKNLVHFAAYRHHIGFYPIPSAIAKFKKELSPYASGEGSAQFPHDKPPPLALVGKITAFRVKETKGKKK